MPRASDPVRRRRRGSRLPDPRELERPWLGAYPPGVPPSYAYPDVPVTRFLDDAVRDFPDVVALDTGRTQLTYARFGDAVERFAAGLASRGIGAGDRVGLRLENGLLAPIALLGTLRVGAVVVPLRPGAATPTDLTVLVATDPGDAGAPLVILDRHRLGARWRDRTRGRLRRDPSVPPGTVTAGTLFSETATVPPRPVAATAPALAVEHVDGPRVLTHANLVAASFQARLWIPDAQAGRERVLAGTALTGPVGLTSCVLHTVLSAGTLLLAPDRGPTGLTAAIADLAPTLVYADASTFADLAHARGVGDLTSIRAAMSLGRALDAETADRFEQRAGGARLRSLYVPGRGLLPTHANPVYGRWKRGTIGVPMTDTVAAVVDDRGRKLVRVGRPGLLLVSGPQLWSAALHDGWLVTDQAVVVDEDGSFTAVRGLEQEETA